VSDEPLACTLPATELPLRLAQIRAIADDALLGRDPDGRLRFRADADTERRLQTLIEAESRCCAQLRFALTAHDGHLALEVSGPGSQAFHRAFTAA
jgi:hypothetical protein